MILKLLGYVGMVDLDLKREKFFFFLLFKKYKISKVVDDFSYKGEFRVSSFCFGRFSCRFWFKIMLFLNLEGKFVI